ncbi:MAG: quinone oxidoreductase family protein [Gaiellaceae bacterium]
MRAAVVSELGRVPEAREVPDPAPGEGEMLMEVLAAPINPIDVAVGAGRFYGGHPELPYVPGCECVGRVAGTRELVWAHGGGLGVRRDGGMAQLLAAPLEALLPLPDDADPVLAGALGIAGLAGWLPVVWRARVRENDVVLVLGATGTVGLVAVQAAKLLGARRVVAAGRAPEGLARAAEVGADATVRLDEEDLTAAFRDACGGDGPTYVVDPLWGEPLEAAVGAAAPGARVVNIGQSAGPAATLTSAAVRGKQLEILGYSNFTAPADVRAREYRGLVERATRGEVRVDVEEVPLERVADAWRRQAEGAGRKLVLVP